MKKIGFITSGGDAPGMNACVRAIVKYCLNKGIVPFGIFDGFQGMIEGRGEVMTFQDVDNIIQRGGTILGTARSKDFVSKEGRAKAIEFLLKNNIDGLVVIGGDGTFTGATILSKEMNIPIIGIPGTIDNDLFGTDYTIGFDTAVNTVVEAVDKIRDTAGSHHRIFFVEVMGRNAGFIALNAAIASGAESVLIPEEITNISELVENIKHNNKGRRSSIILVAEGDDEGGALEILNKVKPYLPDFDLRHTVLGHIQRGGNPTANDRILASRLGIGAVDALLAGKSNLMIGIKHQEIVEVDILKTIKEKDKLDLGMTHIIEVLRTI